MNFTNSGYLRFFNSSGQLTNSINVGPVLFSSRRRHTSSLRDWSSDVCSSDLILLTQVRNTIVSCDRCPRLRTYCQQIAREKRRAYRDETYWGKPVPGFGDPHARLLIEIGRASCRERGESEALGVSLKA